MSPLVRELSPAILNHVTDVTPIYLTKYAIMAMAISSTSPPNLTELTFSKEDIGFQEDPPQDIECPLCLNVIMDDPSQARCCGQQYCGPCIQKSILYDPRCPMCRKDKTEGFEVFKDTKLARTLGSLKIYCINNQDGEDDSCDWEGELRHLREHLHSFCPYKELSCPLCNKNGLLRCDLKKHMEKYCPERPHVCRYCGERGTYVFIVKNHYNTCLLYPVQCPLKCDKKKKLRRNEIQTHLEKNCPLKPIECRYSWIGCKEEPMRKDLESHYTCSMESHQSLLLEQCEYLSFESQQMSKDLDAVEATCIDLKQQQDILANKVKELESKLEMEMNNRRTDIQSLYNKLECDHEKLVNNLEKLVINNKTRSNENQKMIGSIIIALIVILVSVSVLLIMSGNTNLTIIIVVLGLALPLLFYFNYDELANYFYLQLNKIKNNNY